MILEINLAEVFRTSFTIWILLACSVLALTVILERLWYFWKTRIDYDWFFQKLKLALESEGPAGAKKFCDDYPVPIGKVFKTLLENQGLPRPALEDIVGRTSLSERLRAEQYLGILGTLGSMSPFIGLFGTVVGIIQAFHQLALGQAAAGASLVAAGIAEALVATAAGLMVAVPCIMAYNFLAGKVKKIAADMELAKKDYLHYNATKPGELSK